MKTTGWTKLALAGVASALMIIPVVNGTSAIADDNVTVNEAPRLVQSATPGEVTDELHGQSNDRQRLDRKQPQGPVVKTGPDRPGDTSAVRIPKSDCVLLSAGTGWLLPSFDCS